MQELTQMNLTRQELLYLWFKRNDVRQKDIAAKIEVTEASFSRMIHAETISTWRHTQLVAIGIPSEFLPPILDKSPGPKKRKSISVVPATPFDNTMVAI